MDFPVDNSKNNGITPISIAAMKGNEYIMEMLKQKGADVNKESK